MTNIKEYLAESIESELTGGLRNFEVLRDIAKGGPDYLEPVEIDMLLESYKKMVRTVDRIRIYDENFPDGAFKDTGKKLEEIIKETEKLFHDFLSQNPYKE